MPPSNTDKLRRRNRELSILNAIAEALNREVDLNHALHAALAQVAALLDLETGWIWLLHEETGEPYLAAAQNLPPALAHHPERMEGRCYCLDTYRQGDLGGAANVNVVTCTRLKNLIDGTDGLRYHASIPLNAHEKKLGVLNVASADWRQLSPDDLRLLYTVGDLVSMAVERARLFAKSVDLGAVEERNRLAREIHDTLAQGLVGIALRLEAAEALLENEPEAEQAFEVVQKALSLTRANLEEARRSVLDLRAAPLAGRSLSEALTLLVEQLASEHDLDIDLEITGGAQPLPVRLEVGLYRIVQEALNNIVQHAQTHDAIVHLVSTPQAVQLTVEDKGQGFNPAQVDPDSFGLIGLRERAKLLGGRLHVESKPGKGTLLEVVIPMAG